MAPDYVEICGRNIYNQSSVTFVNLFLTQKILPIYIFITKMSRMLIFSGHKTRNYLGHRFIHNLKAIFLHIKRLDIFDSRQNNFTFQLQEN